MRLLVFIFDVPVIIYGLAFLSIKSSRDVLYGLKNINKLVKMSIFQRQKMNLEDSASVEVSSDEEEEEAKNEDRLLPENNLSL